jgi:predicted ATPase/cell fate (sporulation/competence/biofilm development) regulator YlbF (YheA/YmcA/DUF963 family)
MTFRLRNVFFESRHIDLFTVNKGNNRNSFTIIIGPNGIGKSRLLSSIAQTFRGLDLKKNKPNPSLNYKDRKRNYFSLQYEINGELVDLAFHRGDIFEQNYSENHRPEKVICASSSPFDKFPISRYNTPRGEITDEEKSQSTIYKYLGSKNNLGQFSSKSQIKRFIESLVFSTNKSQAEIHRISKVFDFLEYEPRMKVVYRLEASLEILKEVTNVTSRVNFLNIYRKSGRRFFDEKYIENFVNNEPKLIHQINDAARIIINNLEENSRKLVTANLDFRDKYSNNLSSEIFFAASFLGRFGLLYLHDVELFKNGNDKKGISIKDASSGEQCIVVTILGIASEISDNSLICIDEPEISLHPEWQERYIELLTDIFSSFSGCHFILATHSPQILSKVKSEDSNVLLMDEGKLYPASDYAKRSADFQLVEAFKTPGYKNEYLAREALTVYTQISIAGGLNPEYEKQYQTLVDSLPLLEKDDPVAKLIEIIIKAKEASDLD